MILKTSHCYSISLTNQHICLFVVGLLVWFSDMRMQRNCTNKIMTLNCILFPVRCTWLAIIVNLKIQSSLIWFSFSFFILWALNCKNMPFFAGGTFALYSLLCRNMNVGILNSKHADSNLSYSRNTRSGVTEKKTRLVKFLEGSIVARRVLLFIAMLGMCMLIGDGILTPAISG